MRVAAAADGGGEDQFVFACRDVAAHLFHTVKIEVDGAGQGAAAEIGAQRCGLFPRLRVVGAGEFDAADAGSAPRT